MKAYQILKKGWRYNDEYYSDTDNYETPKYIFTDKQKADEQRKKLEIKEFKGLCLGQYGNDGELSGLLNKKYNIEDLVEFGFKTWGVWKDEEYPDMEEDQFDIPSDASNESIEALFKYIKIRFYDLITIDIVE